MTDVPHEGSQESASETWNSPVTCGADEPLGGYGLHHVSMLASAEGCRASCPGSPVEFPGRHCGEPQSRWTLISATNRGLSPTGRFRHWCPCHIAVQHPNAYASPNTRVNCRDLTVAKTLGNYVFL